MQRPLPCPVCAAPAPWLGRVDFNRCCEPDLRLPPSGRLVDWHRCPRCALMFAPEFERWTTEDFARHIYNADYARVDPDYQGARPRANADLVLRVLGAAARQVPVLDYGAGDGQLAARLRQAGVDAESWEPMHGTPLPRRRFALVTAFEVFEHEPRPRVMAHRIAQAMADDALLLFSTLLSDGQADPARPLDWWYLAPRNGHVTLHSRASLGWMARELGLSLASISPAFHLMWRGRPAFAAQAWPGLLAAQAP